jgi:hypothetical protein
MVNSRPRPLIRFSDLFPTYPVLIYQVDQFDVTNSFIKKKWVAPKVEPGSIPITLEQRAGAQAAGLVPGTGAKGRHGRAAYLPAGGRGPSAEKLSRGLGRTRYGAVSFAHRCGASLNRHLHDHCGVLNGVFEPLEAGGVQFRKPQH